MIHTTIGHPLTSEEEERISAAFVALQARISALALDETNPLKQVSRMINMLFDYRKVIDTQFTFAMNRAFAARRDWHRAVRPGPKTTTDDLKELGL